MNCAGWIPIKLWKYKQYPYILNIKERNQMKFEKLKEKMSDYKNFGVKDPF